MARKEFEQVLRDAIVDDHAKDIANFAQDELQRIIKTRKFKNYLRALVWHELKEAMLEMELLKMLPQRMAHFAVKSELAAVVKWLKKNNAEE